MELINGGPGPKVAQAVDEDHRAQTKALSVSVLQVRSDEGKAYCFNIQNDTYAQHGWASLTTAAGWQGLIYIKNTSSTDELHIKKLCVDSDTSGLIQIKTIQNPTGGTLITDAEAGSASNLNLGSGNTFDGVVYMPQAAGETVTGGVQIGSASNCGSGQISRDLEAALIIPKNSSIAIITTTFSS